MALLDNKTQISVLVDGLDHPEGIAWGQDGVVSVYSSGTPEAPFKCPNYPAFDTAGSLYVCASGGFHEDDGLIYRIVPGGERPDVIYRRTAEDQVDILAEDFEGTLIAAPTNIAFCGPDRDVLLGANIGRWHITRYEVGATGHKLNYPQIDEVKP